MGDVSRALYNIPCPVVTIFTEDGESGETVHGDLATHGIGGAVGVKAMEIMYFSQTGRWGNAAQITTLFPL